MAEQDYHDGGLTANMSWMMTRRRVITLLGLAEAGAIGHVALRGAPGTAEANLTGAGADGATCIKSLGETSGPYPVDGTNSIDGQTVNVLQEKANSARTSAPLSEIWRAMRLGLCSIWWWR